MAYIGRSAEGWDYLFSEFEFLLSFGIHPDHAVRQLDYPTAAAMARAYHRQGRPLPPALAREDVWLNRKRKAAS